MSLDAYFNSGMHDSFMDLHYMNLQDKEDEKKKSGFFDLPNIIICRSPQHNPPTHIHIPQGKGYRHICPSCGKITDIIPPQITL